MSKPRAVILDVDGTLVDSNTAHAQAWVEALHEVGLDVGLERVRRLIGMGGDKLLPKAVGLDPEQDAAKTASRRRGEIFKTRYLPGLRPFPGCRELLEHFRDEGLTRAVASSAKPEELKAMLEHVGIADLIEAESSSSDGRSKPDPDTVEGILGRIGRRPDEAIMLGDTPYDVEGAGRAGVQTVALRCGGWDRPELDGAIAIYDDPADLLAHFDESPFAAEAAGRRERRVDRGEREEQSRLEDRAEERAVGAEGRSRGPQ